MSESCWQSVENAGVGTEACHNLRQFVVPGSIRPPTVKTNGVKAMLDAGIRRFFSSALELRNLVTRT